MHFWGSRGQRPATRVVACHVYGFQLSRGLLRPDPATGLLPVIRHRCDEASCHCPSHWVTGSAADNVADFTARGKVPGSPLPDRRGAAARAIAIRAAILAGPDGGDSPEPIEAAIWPANAVGVPGGQAPVRLAQRRREGQHLTDPPPWLRLSLAA